MGYRGGRGSDISRIQEGGGVAGEVWHDGIEVEERG